MSSRDVAKIAGVSQATVSRVMNSPEKVKPDTRIKVLNAMEQLNYYPDSIARSMKNGRTFNIGLIIGGLSNPFFAETAEIIIKTAGKYNCHVTLCVTEEIPWKMDESIDLLITKRVDGVIIGSVGRDDPIHRLKNNNIPFVLYNRRRDREDEDYVIQDNLKGGFDAVSHLIRLGHTKIGALHGPVAFDTVEERMKGYYEALSTNHLRIYDHFVQEIDFTDTESKVEQAMKIMFNDHVKPTALFTTADFLALDAIEYLMANQYRIPQDIALVGFDNTKISGHSLIGLSTVGQQAGEMARLAVERLMKKIENEGGKENCTEMELQNPWNIKLEPQLIVRKTCGANLKDPN
ncbi:LacI family DNA-binding transcriptional regulator [Fictibacillus enclensis]|nr:LacI family DNA-binding transcriptional regulator [Fictibacillus enclensis]